VTISEPGTIPSPDPSCAFFLDVDGTLLELAGSPAEVSVGRRARTLLRRLNTSTGGAVALISGRSIADIDALFEGLTVRVVGQHGSEWRGEGRAGVEVATPGSAFGRARARARALVDANPSLLFEDKGRSIAVHFRRAPHLEPLVQTSMRAICDELGDEYLLQQGKRVVEIRPRGRDKGDAVEALLEVAPFAGRTPVFVGDDVTDEAGFIVVNARDGVSVKVGEGPTTARWRLRDVDAVLSWLEGACDNARGGAVSATITAPLSGS
jgi:trehalose 6-phosphate phosphatase